MQLAAYMGYSKIYIIGVDNGNYIKGHTHFSKEGNIWDERNELDAVFQEKFCRDNEISYEIAEATSYKKGFRIYNATRGGRVNAFERVDLDEVLNKADVTD